MTEATTKSAPKMVVDYFHERPGSYTGNIIWGVHHKSRNGKFAATHPVSPNVEIYGGNAGGQCGKSESITAFRERGYWASCFPEGDGITMKCLKGQNTAQVVQDIREVFGWEVLIKRWDDH